MLRALGRSALLRVCSRRGSMFETLTFSWGPPQEPGLRCTLQAAWRLKSYSWGEYAQVHSLPNRLRWSTGYNFAAP